MATFTSTTSGNISAGSTWVGGVAPGNGTGDVIVVASAGHTVTVESDWILGAKTGTPGHAFTINATNAGTFGTLKVNNGVTLTLRGVDATSNTLGLVNQFGLFQPQTGSTVLGDVPSDYGSVILYKGRFEPQTGVTFGVPSGNVNWASKVNSSSAGVLSYDSGLNLVGLTFPNPLISNGTQTGLGSNGAFPTGQAPNGNQGIYSATGFAVAPANEVAVTFPATPAQIAAAVNAPGKYAVDYDTGTIWIYSTTSTGLNLGVNYFKLDKAAANWRGWGIVSGVTAATSGNTCKIDGCTFNYMGASTSTGKGVNAFACSAPVVLCNHKTAGAFSGDATATAYVKNSTFNYGYKWVQAFQCIGTSGDPILISGNTLRDSSGGTNADGINFFSSYSNFVTIDSNSINTRGTAIDLGSIAADLSTLRITSNSGTCGLGFVAGTSGGGARTPFPFLNDPDASLVIANTQAGSRPSTPDLYIGSNSIRGLGEGGPDSRFLCISGTSGHPAIVELNAIDHCHRLGHQVGSYVTYRKNSFGMSYHHGFTGTLLDDSYLTDIFYYDNLFWNDRGAGKSTSGAIGLAYNHRVRVNNFQVVNNTFDGWKGAVDFGDIVDNNGPLLATNVVVNNNISANGQYAFLSYHSATIPQSLHVLECDYNVIYNELTAYALGATNGLTNTTNPTSFLQGGNKYNRLQSGARNIPGVALFDASYTTDQSGTPRSLAYTVNSLASGSADVTLAWGGGTAVQLAFDSGTSTGQGLRTLACTGKSTWTTNLNSIRSNWLWVVSGTGAGQARAISWASANVAYAATPNGGSTGTGYAVGDYITASGSLDTPGAKVVMKVTSVSSGAITGLSVVSGGTFTAAPANPVTATRATGFGSTCTVNLSFAPGLLLVPDLTTALDSTSVFVILKAYVQLSDSGTGTVHAGLSMTDGTDTNTSVVLPTTSQTDTGITVVVNRSPTGNPNFAGTFPGGLPTGVAVDYKVTAGSSAIDAGTVDNAPSTDYFGVSRPQGAAVDIGFAELVATASNAGGASLLAGM